MLSTCSVSSSISRWSFLLVPCIRCTSSSYTRQYSKVHIAAYPVHYNRCVDWRTPYNCTRVPTHLFPKCMLTVVDQWQSKYLLVGYADGIPHAISQNPNGGQNSPCMPSWQMLLFNDWDSYVLWACNIVTANKLTSFSVLQKSWQLH